MGATSKALVLYDGACPLCRRSVAWLMRLDWLGRLEYADARHPEKRSVPVPPGRLLEEMHLVTPGGERVYHGFAAFRWIAWRLPPLWPLLPWLYLPGVPRVGQWLYLWIARHRFELIPCHQGACTFSDASEKRC